MVSWSCNSTIFSPYASELVLVFPLVSLTIPLYSLKYKIFSHVVDAKVLNDRCRNQALPNTSQFHHHRRVVVLYVVYAQVFNNPRDDEALTKAGKLKCRSLQHHCRRVPRSKPLSDLPPPSRPLRDKNRRVAPHSGAAFSA